MREIAKKRKISYNAVYYSLHRTAQTGSHRSIHSPEDLHALSLTLVMIGKMDVTGAFGFLYLYGTERFPTVVYNMALGATSMATRIGSTVSPYIAYMVMYNKILPYMLMGATTVITGVLNFLLPETKGEELPEMINQVKP
ncbi:solute carrier family 22 member 4-like [Salvelinus namaycush]|uniref:Solute carrier family 22 member 4-like n=1 Tax=Salvelinus namaycush TaxID=8040 RepID=A0A8U1F133_SALNM|nr:solute carrier family 22 member 4-like [Salvelinus namaycush]